jgi:hypothetical protein
MVNLRKMNGKKSTTYSNFSLFGKRKKAIWRVSGSGGAPLGAETSRSALVQQQVILFCFLLEGWLMVEIIKAIQPKVETVLIRYCFLFTESIFQV